MSTPEFGVRLDTNGSTGCAYVTGELDLATADHLRGSVALALSAAGISCLVIDLGEVSFCDSCGLQVLVEAHSSCRRKGVDLVLQRASAHLRSVLRVAGLADYFTIEPRVGIGAGVG